MVEVGSKQNNTSIAYKWSITNTNIDGYSKRIVFGYFKGY
jgi:hypothetical protein